MTIYYEIRIAGAVPPDALLGFEQLAADQPTETMVRGPLPDQAALNGLLARLESAGIQLMRLRRQKCLPPARRGSSAPSGRPARMSQAIGPGD